jgi:hypothetical protein
MKRLFISCTLLSAAIGIPVVHATAIDQLLAEYQASNAQQFSSVNGERMWHQQYRSKKGKPRSCATCHGDNLRLPGKHARTKKSIDALAPSVNAERLTDIKTINKWFKRNCKWTLGRECTAQEKGDFLLFIRNQ